MTLEQFDKNIYNRLRELQAHLVTVEYSNLPVIYSDIKKSIEKMIIDLEKQRGHSFK